MIWCHHPEEVQLVATTEPRSAPSLHFGLDHVMRKYSHFWHLDRDRLTRLFATRWRHVEWPGHGFQMSYLPASRDWLADPWRDLAPTGIPVTVCGTVAGTDHAYFAPALLQVAAEIGTVKVMTWLFLYRGTFSTGDRVTVIGQWATSPAGDVILVEGSGDAIIKH